MDEDLKLSFRRWQAADEAEEDEPADAAFAALYRASLPPVLPSRDLAARTMAAVAAASAAETRRARRARTAVRWLGLPLAAALIYFGAGPLVSTLSSALVGTLNLLVSLVVMAAEGSSARHTVWTTLSGLGRAAAAFVEDPRVTVAMLACQAMAVGALVALHRLLGSGREWLR